MLFSQGPGVNSPGLLPMAYHSRWWKASHPLLLIRAIPPAGDMEAAVEVSDGTPARHPSRGFRGALRSIRRRWILQRYFKTNPSRANLP